MMSRISPNARSDWPAAVVALGILLLLGAVLVTATLRFDAAQVKDLLGTLAPVIGVVTGAFVTYFFTRQAAATASDVAEKAADVARTANGVAEKATTAAQTANGVAEKATTAAQSANGVAE